VLANPILGDGEPAYVTDTNLYKVGNGVTPWNDLPYTGTQGPPGVGVSIKGFVTNQAALPENAELNDVYIVQDTLHGWMWNGLTWVDLGAVQGPMGPQGPAGPAFSPRTYRDLLP
jgi:hypothetical protein